MTVVGRPRTTWSGTAALVAVIAGALGAVLGVLDPALPWEVALIIVAWSLSRLAAASSWVLWVVSSSAVDGWSRSKLVEILVVAAVAVAVHLLVEATPRPLTRLRQAWLVLAALIALSVLSALVIAPSSQLETPKAVVGMFAMASLGAALSWWQDGGRPRAALCAPFAVAAAAALIMLGTAEVLRYRDIDSLNSDAERIRAALVADHRDAVQVLAAETSASSEEPLSSTNFADRLRPVLAGHAAIASVALAMVDADGSTEVLAALDSGDGSSAAALATWIVDEHDNSVQDHSDPGVADYVEMVDLPDGPDGVTAHLVHASAVEVEGGAARTRVVYAALSVPTLLRAASAPTLAGTGGASVVLWYREEEGARRIASVEAVDDSGVLVEVPTDDPELVGTAQFDLLSSTFEVMVRPSVGYGLAHSTLRLLLVSVAFVGLIGFATISQRRITAAAFDDARRRRQALLDAALAGSRGWSAVIDPTGAIRIANDDPLGASEGQSLADVALVAGDEKGLADVVALLERARHDGVARSSYVGADRDGRARIVEMSANVLRETGDEQLCFLQCIDVTDERERSMRLAQADRMEAIGALAGGVAHDFNNLLFITLGYLQLIEQHAERVADQKLTSYVTPAIDAVRRGADVTKALLTVSGQHPINEQALEVAAFVDELAPLIRQAVGKGVEVHQDVEPGVSVQVDVGRLSGSVLNLCANARHALEGRPAPRVDIRVRRVSNDEVTLEVADNGIGMSPEVAARAFEPFFTTRGRANGTGLGLASVFAFAQQSGGSATITSHEGIGTTVTIVLPVAGAGVSGQHPRSPHAVERVLVVDDERDIADLLASWLEPFVDDVRTALSPQVALDLDVAFQPQVLVCDAHLASEIDGLEVARRVLQRRPDTIVIFMTGFADRVRELEAMGAATLAKPFSRDDFLGEMRRRGVVPVTGANAIVDR